MDRHTLLERCKNTSKNGMFLPFHPVCDQQMDGPTNEQTDTPSYKDARMHLTKLVCCPFYNQKLVDKEVSHTLFFYKRHVYKRQPVFLTDVKNILRTSPGLISANPNFVRKL